jgi:pimeloyl-ACP methyl ester carboxylesterase
MEPFVLVHGSNSGGWMWRKVAALLRAAGHEVFAPTLTGLSDRSHLLGCGVDLATHIADVANLLYYADLMDVILVGNSYAGMVITGVAAQAPERLKRLVYLDAYVPEDGQSESDLWPAQVRAERQAEAEAHGGLLDPPAPAVFGITDPELVAWLEARWTPHPMAAYTQPVPPGSAHSAAIPRVYIHCTGNPVTTPPIFAPFAAKARAQGWEVRELAAGHLAMLSAPGEVAENLLSIARGDGDKETRRRGDGGTGRKNRTRIKKKQSADYEDNADRKKRINLRSSVKSAD